MSTRTLRVKRASSTTVTDPAFEYSTDPIHQEPVRSRQKVTLPPLIPVEESVTVCTFD